MFLHVLQAIEFAAHSGGTGKQKHLAQYVQILWSIHSIVPLVFTSVIIILFKAEFLFQFEKMQQNLKLEER